MIRNRITLLMLIVTFAMLLCGCNTNKNKSIDTDTALNYMWELQDYVDQTGDTDIYLWFLEGMNQEYLGDFVKDNFSYSFDEKYNEGQSDGYQEGFSDGARLMLDFMNEDEREKWFEENADIVEEYDISY